ncbi:MAG: cysteine desulfurase [Candidatus Liptonbacteria bacterium]|nr:cysteine desulfurase [Candidatus Liptonbacteria bacterium]
MKKLYFDFAATTPLSPLVREAMEPYFLEKFGNPGSLHSFGQEALKAVDESRQTFARIFGFSERDGFRQIIFTGSATEANNLILRGAVNFFTTVKRPHRCLAGFSPPRLIISSIEHDSVFETAKDLEKKGIEVVIIPVNKKGFVDLKKIKESLNEQTVLVSIIFGSNEIGSIQPISEIAKIIREFRNLKKTPNSKDLINLYPLFHTDSVQSFQYFDCSLEELGLDLATFSSHKIYGPKGIGAFCLKNSDLNKIFEPAITGGGQEFGLRSGTENVASIVGFAKAVEETVRLRDKERKRIYDLKYYFWKKIKEKLTFIKLNAEEDINLESIKKYDFLPHILNICFTGYPADELIIKLDLDGLAVSAGSACSARSLKPSRVLLGLGLSEKQALSSLRFSFGRQTDKNQIEKAIKIITRTFKPNSPR